MRRFIPFVFLSLACANGSEPSSRTELPVSYFTVSGSVLDSVLGVPLADVRVLVGDSAVNTGPTGRFATRYREGATLLVVRQANYDSLVVTRYINRDQEIVLRLRGQAPYVMGCSFFGDSVSATMLDLQGRKTINRRTQSYLVARVQQREVQSDGNDWHWNPVDNFTWRTNALLGGIADSVDWRLEDADGNARSARCVHQSMPCAGCSAHAGAGMIHWMMGRETRER